MRYPLLEPLARWLPAGALLLACATAPDGARPAAGDERFPSSDRLTAAEIATVPAATAYDAVEHLRPAFFRSTRGADAIGLAGRRSLGVYVDGLYLGGIEQLHEIRASLVREVRYLSGPQATALFGTGHSAGALLVLTGGAS